MHERSGISIKVMKKSTKIIQSSTSSQSQTKSTINPRVSAQSPVKHTDKMHSATVFFALAAVVATASSGLVGPVAVANDYYAYPQYRTSYSVSDAVTGDHKSASESRDGGITKGSYSLLQPDGVYRTVNYIVTPLGGFQAQVINSNSGVAVHPGRVAIAHAPIAVAPIAVAAPYGAGKYLG